MLGYDMFMQGQAASKDSTKDKYEVHIKKAPGIFKHTMNPMVTMSSAVGIKFDGGVAVASDVGGYYGKMMRFRNVDRFIKVNSNTLILGSGDYSDFQYIKDVVEQRSISEQILNDDFQMDARSLHSWLTRVMYNRRSKFDPLWNNLMVAGIDHDNKPFIGNVDMLGLSFEENIVATGLGLYIAVPMMRAAVEARGDQPLDKAGAVEILKKCLEVLYYRDCISYDKIRIATITKDGIEISDETRLPSNWEFATKIEGF
ncbi:hypothetical protein GE061_003160 [Apolygus lucorum]|uniref:Proteasome subunit beta n=1 Tax=Apolygus lucorum TaxID=248454 RepID=A0A6A4JN72_APOLU|nr:hypothetical protein GE061_003160 [Apolygus lucorum]